MSEIIGILFTILEKITLGWWTRHEQEGQKSVAEKEADAFAKPAVSDSDVIDRL